MNILTTKPDLSSYRNYNTWYDDALILEQYGYWSHIGMPPERYTPEFLQEAKNFALSLVEPNFELWYETYANGENWNGRCCGAKWITFDSANKILFWENAVGGCLSEKSAESYVKREHYKHVELFGGVLEALLTYKNTGIACLPNWNKNSSDGVGYKNGECNTVPRVRQVLERIQKENT